MYVASAVVFTLHVLLIREFLSYLLHFDVVRFWKKYILLFLFYCADTFLCLLCRHIPLFIVHIHSFVYCADTFLCFWIIPRSVRYIFTKAICITFTDIYCLVSYVVKAHLTFYTLPVTWCTTTSLTFNNCTFCPHCIYVFCVYLRTNSDLCHLQHKLIGFYNRDEKCSQRGTDWFLIYSRLRSVFIYTLFSSFHCFITLHLSLILHFIFVPKFLSNFSLNFPLSTSCLVYFNFSSFFPYTSEPISPDTNQSSCLHL
jgi:hypothetical protein